MWSVFMRRVIGFAMFFVAIGMIIELLIPDVFVGVLVIIVLMLLGYNMFYC